MRVFVVSADLSIIGGDPATTIVSTVPDSVRAIRTAMGMRPTTPDERRSARRGHGVTLSIVDGRPVVPSQVGAAIRAVVRSRVNGDHGAPVMRPYRAQWCRGRRGDALVFSAPSVCIPPMVTVGPSICHTVTGSYQRALTA